MLALTPTLQHQCVMAKETWQRETPVRREKVTGVMTRQRGLAVSESQNLSPYRSQIPRASLPAAREAKPVGNREQAATAKIDGLDVRANTKSRAVISARQIQGNVKSSSRCTLRPVFGMVDEMQAPVAVTKAEVKHRIEAAVTDTGSKSSGSFVGVVEQRRIEVQQTHLVVGYKTEAQIRWP